MANQNNMRHPILDALKSFLGGTSPLSRIMAELMSGANVPEKSAYPQKAERPIRELEELGFRVGTNAPNPSYGQGSKFVIGELPSAGASDLAGRYLAEAIGAIERPEGTRFYRSQAMDPDESRAMAMAGMSLQNRMRNMPADSISTALARNLLGSEDFRQMLSELKSNPDYFSAMKQPTL